MAITVKRAVKKRVSPLEALAKKVRSGAPLNRKTVATVRGIIDNELSDERAAFIKLLKENSHKTDDELLEELRPVLGSTGKRGRPAGQSQEVVDQKCLLAYRLRERNLTLDQIGKQMGVSTQQAHWYVNKAKGLLRVDPKTVDLPQQIGETLHFYDDVRRQALMISSLDTSKAQEKLTAMSVALVAERDKNDFLTRVGVYSPTVVAAFKQIVLQQMNLLVPPDTSPTENFMAVLAKDLMHFAQVEHGVVIEAEGYETDA